MDVDPAFELQQKYYSDVFLLFSAHTYVLFQSTL